jgi:medium-chain acyl-[acyl-carrier-protein] hydrolase
MELIETYVAPPAPPLPLPITAFGGRQDNTVTEPELAAWKAYSSRSFHLHMIEGGHFFHKVPAFLDLLAQSLLEED